MSLVPTDFHLALEAVVAYVDGELSHGAEARATAHLNACPQCSLDVAAQREAKTFLVDSGRPGLPGDLLSRLRQIPFTTDLQTPGMTLAMHGENLQWTRTDGGSDQPAAALPGTSMAPAVAAAPKPPDKRPPGRAEAGTRPETRRSGLSSLRIRRFRRFRRSLVGAVAGLAVGVLAALVIPVTVTAGTATSPNRMVENDPGPGAASALVGSLDSLGEAMTPRRFAGAAIGLP